MKIELKIKIKIKTTVKFKNQKRRIMKQTY